MKSVKSQVWVETVVYTLIGLAIIAIILGIAMPKIRETNDRVLLEQTITAMTDLNEVIDSTRIAAGNSRIVNFKINKGELFIDGLNDSIIFYLKNTNLRFSETGVEIPQGDLILKTQENQKNYDISLELDYSGKFNISYNGQDITKVLSQAPTAYKILIINKGGENIDISLS